MAILSSPITVSVGSFPYAVPPRGQAVLIGTNTEAAVAPPGVSAYNWRYALFRFYGAGVFVRSATAGGAFVSAGGGGHMVPAVAIGGAMFDFTDATWKALPHAHSGVPTPSGGGGDFAASQVDSDGLVISSDGAIAPAHNYLHTLELPRELGGGPKGSLLVTMRHFASASANTGAGATKIAAFNLETRKWSLLSQSSFNLNQTSEIFSDGTSFFDPVTNRIYAVAVENNTNWRYVVPGAWTWQSTSVPAIGGGQRVVSPFFNTSARYGVSITGQYGQSPTNLRVINLDNLAAGWRAVSFTGALPSHYNAWHFFPSDGCWYSKGASGNTINKLTPPASPYTGTWAFSTVAITGATLPTDCIIADDPGVNTHHYSRFFYVPTLQCFAWIAGNAQVALITPP